PRGRRACRPQYHRPGAAGASAVLSLRPDNRPLHAGDHEGSADRRRPDSRLCRRSAVCDASRKAPVSLLPQASRMAPRIDWLLAGLLIISVAVLLLVF